MNQKQASDQVLEENERADSIGIDEEKTTAILDRLLTKLDFDKEVNKYLIILLVFLGLLGTFWGLLITIDSVGKTIGELSIEEENILLTFLSLKESLKAPLAGMGTAFAGKPILRDRIAIQLDYSDLRGLLYLQGYKQADFVCA